MFLRQRDKDRVRHHPEFRITREVWKCPPAIDELMWSERISLMPRDSGVEACWCMSLYCPRSVTSASSPDHDTCQLFSRDVESHYSCGYHVSIRLKQGSASSVQQTCGIWHVYNLHYNQPRELLYLFEYLHYSIQAMDKIQQSSISLRQQLPPTCIQFLFIVMHEYD